MLKKVWLSVLSLGVAVVAFSSATMAWFATQSTSIVDNIDLDIKSQGGILVSLNQDNSWGTSINGNEITDVIAGKKLNHLTYSSTDSKWYTINPDNGSIVKDDASASVISFDIYIKGAIANAAYEVSIMSESTAELVDFDTSLTTIGSGSGFTTDGSTPITGNTFKVNPANALRMRIGASNVDVSGASTFHSAVILENVYAVSAGDGYDVVSKSSLLIANQNTKNNLALNYFASLRKMDPSNDSSPVNGTIDYTTVNSEESTQIITNLAEGEVAKIKFELWLEGYDPSCLDAILNKVIQTDFTLVAQVIPQA